MVILWLRESSPKDGSSRGSLLNPRSQQHLQQQHMEQEEVLHLQVRKHRSTQQQQKELRGENEDGRPAAQVVVRSGEEIGQPQDDRNSKDSLAKDNSNNDQGSRGQQQKGDQHHRTAAAAVKTHTATATTIRLSSKRTRERIKSKVSSLAAAAAASIPKARKAIKGSGNYKNNKSNNGRKSAGKAKHPSEIKNQRGGFKSTKERKQAQLIPVLDEHGVTIEDHFISPRDSDGDGVPDYFVLLRPSGDNVMDLGLFDDDVVAPVAAIPPATAVGAPPVVPASKPVVGPITVTQPIAPQQPPPVPANVESVEASPSIPIAPSALPAATV
ncbi:hypothetical protein EC991_011348 [Linnemannia zychae]|nr:hypothetical protein EC991_011348 [Linnemannia zychae]